MTEPLLEEHLAYLRERNQRPGSIKDRQRTRAARGSVAREQAEALADALREMAALLAGMIRW